MFNETINPENDRKSKNVNKYKVNPYLQKLITDHNLIDIWRCKHKNLKQFTLKRSNNQQASRIDFWLISNHLINKVYSCDIIPAQSKYGIVQIKLSEFLRLRQRVMDPCIYRS